LQFSEAFWMRSRTKGLQLASTICKEECNDHHAYVGVGGYGVMYAIEYLCVHE